VDCCAGRQGRRVRSPEVLSRLLGTWIVSGLLIAGLAITGLESTGLAAAPQAAAGSSPGYWQPAWGGGDANLPALGTPAPQLTPVDGPPALYSQPMGAPNQSFGPQQPYSLAPTPGGDWGGTSGPVGSGLQSGAPGTMGTGSFDPFSAPSVPPGYPNLPPPQSGWFPNTFGTTSPDASTLFAPPQASTYGPWTGLQGPGLLNNPDAYGNQTWSVQSWQRFWQQSDWNRLLHAFRLRHTYIRGRTADRVEINDTEIATSLSFPNFFASQMPLTFSPGFIIHNWAGPDTVVTGADLPGSAYSAYLTLDHSTALNRQFGGEVSFTTGVYSDFSTLTKHSLRFTGTGLGWIRLSPVSTFKLGVEYLDRVDLKLLPAGGLFWTPDPNTRLNFYFPRPKFARRFPNFGNVEVWGYVAGEYGGGSWTIRRQAGFSDQVDLNDMRVSTGLEWIGIRGVTGFAETGYVFERQLVYRSDASDVTRLGSALMFRGGFAF